ncbi:Putative peptidase family protein [Aquisphaera giovannonii]|uniref:Peptidase family protein n=1 Tax=Aquisphaera giovannonii TaxID=406548 RepID=A0A5B9W649_9BACT|nr:hypothetical protein [Aquisphaera giovannonii]QEH35807.1 Putative peptidase family protein [Aquisphaera giovannonii]
MRSLPSHLTPLAFAACFLIFASGAALADINLENVKDGETVRHPLMLLRGEATGPGPLRVVNSDNRFPAGRAEAPIVAGRFVALVELRPGANRLTLDCGERPARKLTLTFKPPTTEYRLKVVYVTDRDGNTRYITQRPDDPQNYAERLDTAAKLLQTFTAESLHDQGLGRRTFALELDDRGKVVVHTERYPEAGDVLRGKSGNELYGMLYGWIDERFPMNRSKDMVLMGFSGYDPATKEAKAHTALGGGGQGLFSNLFLFCWPDSPADVTRAFLDRTPVDRDKVFHDVGLPTLDRLASTTLGATLHEMGHAFGLPHTSDPRCIMSRGFDNFRLNFLAADQADRGPEPVRPEHTAWFSPYMAAKLARSRWFQPDARAYDESSPPRIRFDHKRQRFEIEAARGIESVFAHVGHSDVQKGVFRPIKGTPRTFSLALKSLRAELGDEGTLYLTAYDTELNQADLDTSRLKDPAQFLTSWRLVEHPIEYPDADAPAPTPAQLEAIRATLRDRPRDRQPVNLDDGTYSADLKAVFGASSRVAAYALREFTSEQAREAKLLAGGDDGFRVWLNGKLVLDRPGATATPADSSEAAVRLAKGRNEILVQSIQGVGGWGFSVRLAHPDGRPIALDGGTDAKGSPARPGTRRPGARSTPPRPGGR